MDDRRQRFEQVAAEVWEPLQRYLRRRAPQDLADDVLSDALLVLWRRLDDAPADAVLPWAYGVARGCLANARRGEERRLSLVQRVRRERVPTPDAGDPRVTAALARLRPADAEVLRLWAWEGLEARDVAAVVGCSAGAAASRLSRARAALREELQRQDPRSTGHPGVREGEGAPT